MDKILPQPPVWESMSSIQMHIDEYGWRYWCFAKKNWKNSSHPSKHLLTNTVRFIKYIILAFDSWSTCSEVSFQDAVICVGIKNHMNNKVRLKCFERVIHNPWINFATHSRFYGTKRNNLRKKKPLTYLRMVFSIWFQSVRYIHVCIKAALYRAFNKNECSLLTTY